MDVDFEHITFKWFVLDYVREIRLKAPRLGSQKLFEMCKHYFGPKFRMGRDAFYRLLRESDLMLRRRRRKTRTTYSAPFARFYPNLIKGLVPTVSNQVWVSDITYIWSVTGFCYLFLITDLYSHGIMGWVLFSSLKCPNAEDALLKAIKTADCNVGGLIHHSDRGVQYTSSPYMNLLAKNKMKASRTEHGDPLENAVAERVNGILKQEWLSLYTFENEDSIRQILEPAITFYNHDRPHASNDWLTPESAYYQTGLLRRRWKNYYPSRKVDLFTTPS